MAVSIPATFYPFYQTLSLATSVNNAIPIIKLDTGYYYLLLMSVFWPMMLIEILGQREKEQVCSTLTKWLLEKAGGIFIGWFITCLAMGFLGSWAAPAYLESQGYYACKNPDSISRVGRGQSIIFSLSPCSETYYPRAH